MLMIPLERKIILLERDLKIDFILVEKQNKGIDVGEIYSNISGTLSAIQKVKYRPETVYTFQTGILQDQCTLFQTTLHKKRVHRKHNIACVALVCTQRQYPLRVKIVVYI